MRLKIIAAEKGIGMDETEAFDFLSSSKSTVRLATLDASGLPIIHPTWFYFDPGSKKLYIFTARDSAKAKNIGRSGRIYFDIDDDRPPYKGVRGRGTARILKKGKNLVAIAEKIMERYIPLSSSMAKSYASEVERGNSVVIEIMPRYLATWDYGKQQ